MYRLRARGQDILLLERVKSLLFGVYAWADNDKRHKVREAGSGVFIAPRLGLTAKHVGQSFSRLDPQAEAIARRRSPLDSQYRVQMIQSEYAAMAYQVVRDGYMPPPEEQILWKLHVNWPSFDTDISILSLEPGTPAAEKIEREQRYLQWHLLPPPIGAYVQVFGFPKADVIVEGVDHDVDAGLEIAVAQVVEHCYPFHDHGMVNFPVFRLDRDLPDGFSGGPVIWNNKLVGLFSGPFFVAELWPLALLTYPAPECAEERSFAHLLDSGAIDAWDWDEVRDGVRRLPCESVVAGTRHKACAKMHVVRSS